MHRGRNGQQRAALVAGLRNAEEAKRLKELEAENKRLKQLLAESELDKLPEEEAWEGNVYV
ncbi:MAG: hypothetical protein KatS3mg111_1058 [Pirellulaceae bacterium]|nr:MAG: hypothetical protein KatS3mg111_1058 [Pirellulaceae bacterium]